MWVVKAAGAVVVAVSHEVEYGRHSGACGAYLQMGYLERKLSGRVTVWTVVASTQVVVLVVVMLVMVVL